MTQTDGEKELVLGNKQLISLFFVVVALCGVFFAMGYIIGRNSAKATIGGNTESGTPPSGATAQRPQPETPREPAPEPVAQPVESTPAPLDTKPAQDVAQEPAPQTAPSQREDKPARSSSGAVTVTRPEPGTSYLQVTALPRTDAENVIRTLREQSFPAVLAESSKDGLFRVLVGPYSQTSQLAEAKARLKTLGFANAFVQKQ